MLWASRSIPHDDHLLRRVDQPIVKGNLNNTYLKQMIMSLNYETCK